MTAPYAPGINRSHNIGGCQPAVKAAPDAKPGENGKKPLTMAAL
jgi:hypothetical protein